MKIVDKNVPGVRDLVNRNSEAKATDLPQASIPGREVRFDKLDWISARHQLDALAYPRAHRQRHLPRAHLRPWTSRASARYWPARSRTAP